MSEVEPASISSEPERIWAVPTPGALWLMRLLALAALLVAGFLLSMEIIWVIAKQQTAVPFCSPTPWLDCESVLSQPRWSKWFGIPVSVPAVVLYGLVTIALFMMNTRRSPAVLQRLWWILSFAAPVILLAGGWFVYVQVVQIEKLCLWCLIDHTLGMMLALMLLLFGVGLIRRVPVALGVVAVAVLIGGQLAYTPPQVIPVAGDVDNKGIYTEEGPAELSIPMMAGYVVLNASQHPVIGRPDAKFMLVEVMDYTCPRCRRLNQTLHEALPRLGPDFAAMVITFPLDTSCNRLIPETEPRHVGACTYAKLAHAVSVLDDEAFEAFHTWLFAQQDTPGSLTPQTAIEHAATLVDRGRLIELLADPRMDVVIQRDIELGQRMAATALPGLYLGNGMFPDIPEDVDEFVEMIRTAAERHKAP